MKPEDYQEIITRKDAGLITMRKHPILDLEICNYTPKTQYNKLITESYIKSLLAFLLKMFGMR